MSFLAWSSSDDREKKVITASKLSSSYTFPIFPSLSLVGEQLMADQWKRRKGEWTLSGKERRLTSEENTNRLSLLPSHSSLHFSLSRALMTKNRLREKWREEMSRFINLRTSEIHLFYNLQVFYWHFLEILWLFIFLVLYLFFLSFSFTGRRAINGRPVKEKER